MPPKATPTQWIQSAIQKSKRGLLSRQLGIPEEDNIPGTLLKVIKHAGIGEMVYNPTTKGKRWIRITRLLKRRAKLALTLKGMKK